MLPTHIAIIMDGNRRWAKSHGLPVMAGHSEGVKAVRRVLKEALRSGIKILTLYAFSTENWRRPKNEIKVLMDILWHYLDTECGRLMDNGIRLDVFGDTEKFPARLRAKIDNVKTLTKHNSRLILNLALNYGGRDEIVRAVRLIAGEVKEKKLKIEEISEDSFVNYLYTKGVPDPELLIRTSGELRLSNFLLWQSSYSEIYISRKLWPDFGGADLKKAIGAYKKRKRRLGG